MKKSLKHIHITPNTDGTAHIMAHNAPTGGPGMPMGDSDGDESMSGSPEEAGAHVTRMLKNHFSSSDDKYAKHPAKSAFGR